MDRIRIVYRRMSCVAHDTNALRSPGFVSFFDDHYTIMN
jgi:hypothetical protein